MGCLRSAISLLFYDFLCSILSPTSSLVCKIRAEKFGVEYKDPSHRREFRTVALKERAQSKGNGFATGFDIFSEEEMAKRSQRAERFGMPGSGLQWMPPQQEEDELKRKSRAERFGVEYQPPDETGLMDVDLHQERKDPLPDAERRPEAVHVYGVDLLSTKDLLRYFADYGPTYIEWINDSAANVIFKDGPTAKRAMTGLGKPLPSEELPQGMDVQDPSAIEHLWLKGEDFIKSGSNIPLIFRTATILDVKPAERVPSRRLWLTVGTRGSGKGRGYSKRSGLGGHGRFSHHGGQGVKKKQRRHRHKKFNADDVEVLVENQLKEQGGESRYPSREAVDYGDL